MATSHWVHFIRQCPVLIAECNHPYARENKETTSITTTTRLLLLRILHSGNTRRTLLAAARHLLLLLLLGHGRQRGCGGRRRRGFADSRCGGRGAYWCRCGCRLRCGLGSRLWCRLRCRLCGCDVVRLRGGKNFHGVGRRLERGPVVRVGIDVHEVAAPWVLALELSGELVRQCRRRWRPLGRAAELQTGRLG